MESFYSYILSAWNNTSLLEVIAVMFAVAYLLLAIKESLWCWPAALISTLIYVYLFFDVNLYMESLLQIFYIVMAFYGWYQWSDVDHADDRDDIQKVKISCWTLKQHLLSFTIITVLVAISATLLSNTSAAFPWLDSFTTWSAVIATWMVTKKILENWIYWFVIDSVNIFLYLQKGLYLTSILFGLYVILTVVGYAQWRKSFK